MYWFYFQAFEMSSFVSKMLVDKQTDQLVCFLFARNDTDRFCKLQKILKLYQEQTTPARIKYVSNLVNLVHNNLQFVKNMEYYYVKERCSLRNVYLYMTLGYVSFICFISKFM